jgi:hypothetical protein
MIATASPRPLPDPPRTRFNPKPSAAYRAAHDAVAALEAAFGYTHRETIDFLYQLTSDAYELEIAASRAAAQAIDRPGVSDDDPALAARGTGTA